MTKVSPELPFADAAAVVLPPLVDAVFACEAATRAGDPEAGVHDMRVATKRLREAWRAWGPAARGRGHGRLEARIERLNDALGAVRDPDVVIARVTKLAEGGAPLGLDVVLARWTAARQRAFEALITELDAQAGTPGALFAAIAEIAASPRHHVADRTLGEMLSARIAASARRVRRRWEIAGARATPEALHAARKANKRLRYAIEPYQEVLPAGVVEALPDVIALHDALGDVHDADELGVLLDTAILRLPRAQRATWGPLVGRLDQRRRRAVVDAGDAAEALVAGIWPALEALGGT